MRFVFWSAIILSFLLGCGPNTPIVNKNSKTELVVTYQGKEVHRRSSRYINQKQLTDLVNSGSPNIIVFSADWCAPCKVLRHAVTQANLKINVHYINLDEEWVQQIAALMQIRTIPYMIHTDGNGKTVASKGGLGPVAAYLLVRF